jgi:hypothetical protein
MKLVMKAAETGAFADRKAATDQIKSRSCQVAGGLWRAVVFTRRAFCASIRRPLAP